MNIEDYTFDWVQRPLFVQFSVDGGVHEVFCKVCGSHIAGIKERVVDQRTEPDGRRTEIRTRQFTRTEKYCELKMEFWNGSYHVTNGCSDCLTEKLTTDQMHELHIADLLTDGGSHIEINKMRAPRRVVLRRVGGGGIE